MAHAVEPGRASTASVGKVKLTTDQILLKKQEREIMSAVVRSKIDDDFVIKVTGSQDEKNRALEMYYEKFKEVVNATTEIDKNVYIHLHINEKMELSIHSANTFLGLPNLPEGVIRKEQREESDFNVKLKSMEKDELSIYTEEKLVERAVVISVHESVRLSVSKKLVDYIMSDFECMGGHGSHPFGGKLDESPTMKIIEQRYAIISMASMSPLRRAAASMMCSFYLNKGINVFKQEHTDMLGCSKYVVRVKIVEGSAPTKEGIENMIIEKLDAKIMWPGAHSLGKGGWKVTISTRKYINCSTTLGYVRPGDTFITRLSAIIKVEEEVYHKMNLSSEPPTPVREPVDAAMTEPQSTLTCPAAVSSEINEVETDLPSVPLDQGLKSTEEVLDQQSERPSFTEADETMVESVEVPGSPAMVLVQKPVFVSDTPDRGLVRKATSPEDEKRSRRRQSPSALHTPLIGGECSEVGAEELLDEYGNIPKKGEG